MSIPVRLLRRCARPSSHAHPPLSRFDPPPSPAPLLPENSPSPASLGTIRALAAPPAASPAPLAPLPEQIPTATPRHAPPMPSACHPGPDAVLPLFGVAACSPTYRAPPATTSPTQSAPPRCSRTHAG